MYNKQVPYMVPETATTVPSNAMGPPGNTNITVTTVTVPQSPTTTPWREWFVTDWSYVKTPFGFLRIIQLVVVIGGYISWRSCGWVGDRRSDMNFAMYGNISWFTIVIILFNILAFILGIGRRNNWINVPVSIMMRDLIVTWLHSMVIFLMIVTTSSYIWMGSHVAILIFAVIGLFLFAISLYFDVKDFKAFSVGQPSTQVLTVDSPRNQDCFVGQRNDYLVDPPPSYSP